MTVQDHADSSRPWWATEDPRTDRLDPDEDPLETTISARRRTGERPGERPNRGTDPHAATEDTGGRPADHGATEVCGVCPVCAGWRYLRQHHPDVATHLAAAGRHLSDAHPDVVDHLAAAGRHLTAALRQVLDDHGESEGSDRAEPDPPFRSRPGTGHRTADGDRFERIDLDDGEGQG